MTPNLPPVLPGFSELIYHIPKHEGLSDYCKDVMILHNGQWYQWFGISNGPFSLRLGSAIARANGIGGVEIPDGLPDLPLLPHGYVRWEYRGKGWIADRFKKIDLYAAWWPKNEGWSFYYDTHPSGSEQIYFIEAVKEPTSDPCESESPKPDEGEIDEAKWINWTIRKRDSSGDEHSTRYVSKIGPCTRLHVLKSPSVKEWLGSDVYLGIGPSRLEEPTPPKSDSGYPMGTPIIIMEGGRYMKLEDDYYRQLDASAAHRAESGNTSESNWTGTCKSEAVIAPIGVATGESVIHPLESTNPDSPKYHGGFMSPERAQKLESDLAAARKKLEAEQLDKQTAIELLNERGRKLKAANEEIELLRAWKDSAMTVLGEWDAVSDEAQKFGSFPLGSKIPEETLKRVKRLQSTLVEIRMKANHSIPHYAYWDNEAACMMQELLSEILSLSEKAALAPASPNNSLAPNGWRTIDTAPRDGTACDMWCFPPYDADYGPENGGIRFTDIWWHEADDIKLESGWVRMTEDGNWDLLEVSTDYLPAWIATHWRPLPTAPASSGKGEG